MHSTGEVVIGTVGTLYSHRWKLHLRGSHFIVYRNREQLGYTHKMNRIMYINYTLVKT